MGLPAAKSGDIVRGMDIHILLVSPALIPIPTPLPFDGLIGSGLSTNVNIGGRPAATVGSLAINTVPHFPTIGLFQRPPSNQATILTGSATVFINGRPAARNGDTAMTCNDPVDAPMGTVIATGNVNFG